MVIGLTITPTLMWNKRVNNIISKSSKRIYPLVQLKPARVPDKNILQFYSLVFAQSWNMLRQCFITHYQSTRVNEIEHVQKRGLRIV